MPVGCVRSGTAAMVRPNVYLGTADTVRPILCGVMLCVCASGGGAPMHDVPRVVMIQYELFAPVGSASMSLLPIRVSPMLFSH